MDAAAWIGPAIVAAFISAAVTAVGWYVARRHEIRREAERRRERVIDMQTAILAEIRASRHRLGGGAALQAEMPFAEPGFTPFVPRQVEPFVFRALLADIHLLPTAVIDQIVVYYQQLASIERLAEDLRETRYDQLSQARKEAVYRDYLALLGHLDTLGARAIRTLAQSLNIQDVDGSGPLSAAGQAAASASRSSASPAGGMPADGSRDPRS